MSDILRRINRMSLFMNHKLNRGIYEVRRIDEENFLKSFPEPGNYMERSYAQYCCQNFFRNKALVIMNEIVSVPLLLYYLTIFRIINKKPSLSEKKDAVYLENGIGKELIPESLRKEFHVIEQARSLENLYIGSDELKFWKKCRTEHPFHFFFNMKILIKIANYGYLFQKYRPKAIITYTEVSFASSVLTEYCHFLGMEHINVMHGEKVFHIRDSFFSFDRYYLWDQYYEKLFQKLRTARGQFIVEEPDMLKYEKSDKEEKKIDYTFYLQDQTVQALYKLQSVISVLCVYGYKVKVRPHPRTFNQEEILRLFDKELLENGKEITVEQSLRRTRYAVSLGSTVLYQAYKMGITVVLDDISDHVRYISLKERDFIMFQKEHRKLSDIMKEIVETEGGNTN